MRSAFLFILILFLCFISKAQKYGNEWINFSQAYHKIPISREGIYRIDSTTLAAYYDLNTVNPKHFQLFLKGREQFLYIHGENDNKINSGDYLEFYASPYMGDIDSLVYTNINYVPNPYQALYNDTLYAFLTLNNSLSNKRYSLETDTSSALYPAADHFYTEKIFKGSSSYNAAGEFSEGSSDPHLTQAEGRGQNVSLGAAYTPPVSGLNPYTLQPLPFYVTVNYSGSSRSLYYSPDHQVQLYYNDQNNSPVLLSDTTFYGFSPVQKRFILNSQNTGNNSSITLSCVIAPSFTNNNTTVAWHYTHFFYPHTTTLNGESSFGLAPDDHPSATKQFYNFANVQTGGASFFSLLDLSNGRKITTVVNGSQVRAVIPNGPGRKRCYMASEADLISVQGLYKVNGTGYFRHYKNAATIKPYVLIYHKSLAASAMDYKAYRQSVTGGGFQVIDADIESLYEQFSYGVKKHPLSVRHFIRYLKDSLLLPPEYVLLIGKACGYMSSMAGSYQSVNLIPTIGVPSSDNLLTALLSAGNTNGYYPEIPIGRIAALTNAEVSTYLSKVQQHETPGSLTDWRKQVLHFIGGDTEDLLNQLTGYMSGYEQTVKDTLFGGQVTTVKKNTTAPVQQNISDSLRNVINRGAALINFFGHGSHTGFDQAVDDPDMYSNKDKYPFVIANSCYSGDIHIPNIRSISERFVFADQKGSIGFLATPSFGFPWNLNNFTSVFYRALSQTHYHRGIGDIIRESSFQNSTGDILTRLVALEMTLSGDPALKVSNGLLPDYQVFNQNVAFDLKTYTDSVGVLVSYKNLGKAIQDSFAIKLERFFPNGDSSSVIRYVQAPMYRDTFVHYFPIDFNRGIGLNTFRVMLDHYRRITEASEMNNVTDPVELFIPGGDILPVYPYKYAVIPSTTTITLKASTTDPFAPLTTYRLELDTCDRFSSLISSTLISSHGGVLEWTVPLPYGDSVAYFWRVSRDSISAEKSFAWRESSFQTITHQRGWAQSHFHQFKNNGYRFVNYKKEQGLFVFENNKHSVQCRTGIHPFLHLSNFNYYFDTHMKEGWSSAFDGWNFAVFDSISGQPQQIFSPNYPNTGPGQYNNCIEHGSRYVYSFGAWSACGSPPTWKTDMENFLNAVPANQYVLAYSTGLNAPAYSQVSSYSNSLYNAFESIGAKDIRTVADTVPYILFGRKGMSAGQANVMIGTSRRSVLFLEDSIRTRWTNGDIVSELIGPSYKWNSLHWRVQDTDLSPGDTTVLKLVGVRQSGQEDTLASFPQSQTDVNDLSHYADAATYPYLKLVAVMKDNIHRTSPQLKRWQILYDEAPECAINPLKGFTSINDSLQEGDVVTFKFPIENIGIRDFSDSLVVTYWIENKDRSRVPLPHRMKAPPFRAGQILIDTVNINTYQLQGNNALWIFVNPVSDPRYQPEQSQFNNIGRFPFRVSSDITNPLLDVTFDGVRILNGDLVSARPDILITLKDENKFLALNDTAAFTIFLQGPDLVQRRIYFGEQLIFTPARLPKNSCSIQYNPSFTSDGKYTLSVQAKDRSNNASAAKEYRVQFEVNNHPSVTRVLNYPNPFSTSTRFVFTLTGSEVPEVFTIQILTITGKVVREITRSELGNLRIGRNITDFAWDGRDNFGDRLGNGVYLYRVITRLNGNSIDHKASGADKFFVKEFGKMVLMR